MASLLLALQVTERHLQVNANNTLTINNITGTGAEHWVSFHYINTDGLFGDLTLVDADTLSLIKQRNATVSVNGGPELALAQYDTNAGIVMSVPLLVNLTEGSGNSITIGAVAGRKYLSTYILLLECLYCLRDVWGSGLYRRVLMLLRSSSQISSTAPCS